MACLTQLPWPVQLNLSGMGLEVCAGHVGREVHCGMGPRFWTKLDFPGLAVPQAGALVSALGTPKGKYLPLAVGPVGEDGTVSHWLCPCATKLVEHKEGRSDK